VAALRAPADEAEAEAVRAVWWGEGAGAGEAPPLRERLVRGADAAELHAALARRSELLPDDVTPRPKDEPEPDLDALRAALAALASSAVLK